MLLIERHLAGPIGESLKDTPAVSVNGPRQSGKTTLVGQLANQMDYYTLDDLSTLYAAQQDPVGFVRTLDRAVID